MWLGIVAIISLFYFQTDGAFLSQINHQIVVFLNYSILSLFLMSRLQLEKRYSRQVVSLITICSITVLGGTLEIIREFYVQNGVANIINFIINTLAATIASIAYLKWIWTPMNRMFSMSFKKVDISPSLQNSVNFS